MPKKPARPRRLPLWLSLILLLLLAATVYILRRETPQSPSEAEPQQISPHFLKEIDLPSPSKTGRFAVEVALQRNQPRRKFFDRPLNLRQLSQLLWSLQGVTASWGGRTAPSVRSTYPLEVYAIARNVDNLEAGLYHYLPGDLEPLHKLGLLKAADLSPDILAAAKQSSVQNAPLVLVITGNFQKMTDAFAGTPADHNVYLEAGAAAQNLYLQLESLGLGGNAITTFDAPATYKLIGSPVNEKIIYLIPVGYPDES